MQQSEGSPEANRLMIRLEKVQLVQVLCFASLTLLPIGCSPSDSGFGERKDILTCDSPEAALQAVFYGRQAGGAAGSQEEFVSVRRHKTDAKETVVFQMGHGYDVRLNWMSASRLVISYPRDAVVIGNPWKHFSRELAGARVDVELVAAPAK